MFRSKSGLFCCKKANLISSKFSSKSIDTSWTKFNNEKKYSTDDLLETHTNKSNHQQIKIRNRLPTNRKSLFDNRKNSCSCKDNQNYHKCSSNSSKNCDLEAKITHNARINESDKHMFHSLNYSKHGQSISDHVIKAIKKTSSIFISIPKGSDSQNKFGVRFRSKTLDFRSKNDLLFFDDYNRLKDDFTNANFNRYFTSNSQSLADKTGTHKISSNVFHNSSNKSKKDYINLEMQTKHNTSKSYESFFSKYSSFTSISQGIYGIWGKSTGNHILKKNKLTLNCVQQRTFHSSSRYFEFKNLNNNISYNITGRTEFEKHFQNTLYNSNDALSPQRKIALQNLNKSALKIQNKCIYNPSPSIETMKYNTKNQVLNLSNRKVTQTNDNIKKTHKGFNGKKYVFLSKTSYINNNRKSSEDKKYILKNKKKRGDQFYPVDKNNFVVYGSNSKKLNSNYKKRNNQNDKKIDSVLRFNACKKHIQQNAKKYLNYFSKNQNSHFINLPIERLVKTKKININNVKTQNKKLGKIKLNRQKNVSKSVYHGNKNYFCNKTDNSQTNKNIQKRSNYSDKKKQTTCVIDPHKTLTKNLKIKKSLNSKILTKDNKALYSKRNWERKKLKTSEISNVMNSKKHITYNRVINNFKTNLVQYIDLDKKTKSFRKNYIITYDKLKRYLNNAIKGDKINYQFNNTNLKGQKNPSRQPDKLNVSQNHDKPGKQSTKSNLNYVNSLTLKPTIKSYAASKKKSFNFQVFATSYPSKSRNLKISDDPLTIFSPSKLYDSKNLYNATNIVPIEDTEQKNEILKPIPPIKNYNSEVMSLFDKSTYDPKIILKTKDINNGQSDDSQILGNEQTSDQSFRVNNKLKPEQIRFGRSDIYIDRVKYSPNKSWPGKNHSLIKNSSGIGTDRNNSKKNKKIIINKQRSYEPLNVPKVSHERTKNKITSFSDFHYNQPKIHGIKEIDFNHKITSRSYLSTDPCEKEQSYFLNNIPDTLISNFRNKIKNEKKEKQRIAEEPHFSSIENNNNNNNKLHWTPNLKKIHDNSLKSTSGMNPGKKRNIEDNFENCERLEMRRKNSLKLNNQISVTDITKLLFDANKKQPIAMMSSESKTKPFKTDSLQNLCSTKQLSETKIYPYDKKISESFMKNTVRATRNTIFDKIKEMGDKYQNEIAFSKYKNYHSSPEIEKNNKDNISLKYIKLLKDESAKDIKEKKRYEKYEISENRKQDTHQNDNRISNVSYFSRSKDELVSPKLINRKGKKFEPGTNHHSSADISNLERTEYYFEEIGPRDGHLNKKLPSKEINNIMTSKNNDNNSVILSEKPDFKVNYNEIKANIGLNKDHSLNINNNNNNMRNMQPHEMFIEGNTFNMETLKNGNDLSKSIKNKSYSLMTTNISNQDNSSTDSYQNFTESQNENIIEKKNNFLNSNQIASNNKADVEEVVVSSYNYYEPKNNEKLFENYYKKQNYTFTDNKKSKNQLKNKNININSKNTKQIFTRDDIKKREFQNKSLDEVKEPIIDKQKLHIETSTKASNIEEEKIFVRNNESILVNNNFDAIEAITEKNQIKEDIKNKRININYKSMKQILNKDDIKKEFDNQKKVETITRPLTVRQKTVSITNNRSAFVNNNYDIIKVIIEKNQLSKDKENKEVSKQKICESLIPASSKRTISQQYLKKENNYDTSLSKILNSDDQSGIKNRNKTTENISCDKTNNVNENHTINHSLIGINGEIIKVEFKKPEHNTNKNFIDNHFQNETSPEKINDLFKNEVNDLLEKEESNELDYKRLLNIAKQVTVTDEFTNDVHNKNENNRNKLTKQTFEKLNDKKILVNNDKRSLSCMNLLFIKTLQNQKLKFNNEKYKKDPLMLSIDEVKPEIKDELFDKYNTLKTNVITTDNINSTENTINYKPEDSEPIETLVKTKIKDLINKKDRDKKISMSVLQKENLPNVKTDFKNANDIKKKSSLSDNKFEIPLCIDNSSIFEENNYSSKEQIYSLDENTKSNFNNVQTPVDKNLEKQDNDSKDKILCELQQHYKKFEMEYNHILDMVNKLSGINDYKDRLKAIKNELTDLYTKWNKLQTIKSKLLPDSFSDDNLFSNHNSSLLKNDHVKFRDEKICNEELESTIKSVEKYSDTSLKNYGKNEFFHKNKNCKNDSTASPKTIIPVKKSSFNFELESKNSHNGGMLSNHSKNLKKLHYDKIEGNGNDSFSNLISGNSDLKTPSKLTSIGNSDEISASLSNSSLHPDKHSISHKNHTIKCDKFNRENEKIIFEVLDNANADIDLYSNKVNEKVNTFLPTNRKYRKRSKSLLTNNDPLDTKIISALINETDTSNEEYTSEEIKVSTSNSKLFDAWGKKMASAQNFINEETGKTNQKTTLSEVDKVIEESHKVFSNLKNFVLKKNNRRDLKYNNLRKDDSFFNLKLSDLKRFISDAPRQERENLKEKSLTDVENNGSLTINLIKKNNNNSENNTDIESLDFKISAKALYKKLSEYGEKLKHEFEDPVTSDLCKIDIERNKTCNSNTTYFNNLDIPEKTSLKFNFGSLSLNLEPNFAKQVLVPPLKSLKITLDDSEDNRMSKTKSEIEPEIKKIQNLITFPLTFNPQAEFFQGLSNLKNKSKINATKKFTEKLHRFSACIPITVPYTNSSVVLTSADVIDNKSCIRISKSDFIQPKSSKLKSRIPCLTQSTRSKDPKLPQSSHLKDKNKNIIHKNNNKNCYCEYIFQDFNLSSISSEEKKLQEEQIKLNLLVPLNNITNFPLINQSKEKYKYQNNEVMTINYNSANNNNNINTSEMPSVTEVLKHTMSDRSRALLERWQQKMVAELGIKGLELLKKEKQKQGEDFHDCMREYVSGTPIQNLKSASQPNITELIFSLQHILSKIDDVKVIGSEVTHSYLPYKGNVDCIAMYKGKPTLIEWKHSDKKKPYITWTYDAPLQMVAHLGAVNYDDNYRFPVKNGMVIVAYTDGTPADVFWLNRDSCQYYWKKWLKRLHQFIATTITE